MNTYTELKQLITKPSKGPSIRVKDHSEIISNKRIATKQKLNNELSIKKTNSWIKQKEYAKLNKHHKCNKIILLKAETKLLEVVKLNKINPVKKCESKTVESTINKSTDFNRAQTSLHMTLANTNFNLNNNSNSIDKDELIVDLKNKINMMEEKIMKLENTLAKLILVNKSDHRENNCLSSPRMLNPTSSERKTHRGDNSDLFKSSEFVNNSRKKCTSLNLNLIINKKKEKNKRNKNSNHMFSPVSSKNDNKLHQFLNYNSQNSSNVIKNNYSQDNLLKSNQYGCKFADIKKRTNKILEGYCKNFQNLNTINLDTK